MYNPVQDAVEKTIDGVVYLEVGPPPELADLVHCFWEMKTESTLPDDFWLHALPDACVNVLLDQQRKDVAGITALNTTYTRLNLGKSFHYVGIQLFPGVWRGDPTEIVDRYVGKPYVGTLPLVEANSKLAGLNFVNKQRILVLSLIHI